MPTEDANSSGHLVLSHLGFAIVLSSRPLTHNHTLHHQLMTLSLIWLFAEFDITEYRFLLGICNGCGMPTGDAYSSGHLVLSHFGTCMCSNVETNLSWTCLVSGLLNFEHPSVLLFWSLYELKSRISWRNSKLKCSTFYFAVRQACLKINGYGVKSQTNTRIMRNGDEYT